MNAKFCYIFNKFFLPGIFLIVFLISCQNYSDIPEEVKFSLKISGTNENELVKAINHYQGEGDSLKLKAVFFLIQNMPGHHSYYADNLNDIKEYYPLIGENFGILDKIEATLDSVRNVIGEITINNRKKIYDTDVITAEILIENIDWAFDIWYKTPWHDDYSFDFFCEHILPYRSSNEPLESFRPQLYEMFNWVYDSVENIDDPAEYYSLIFNHIRKNVFYSSPRTFFAFDMSLSDMLMAKTGACTDEANLISLTLRTFGIPHVYDKIPNWANRLNIHDWLAFVEPDGTTKFIMFDEKLPSYHGNVHASQFYKGWQNEDISMVPSHIQVVPEKLIAKAYRMQFSKLIIPSNQEEISQDSRFKMLFKKDVTNKYIQTSNVSIPNPDTNAFIFLSLFNKSSFKPVAIPDEQKVSELEFKNLGHNIVYFPCALVDGKTIISGHPFSLTENNGVQYIIPDIDTRQTVYLYRKYPLFLNIVAYANYMVGGVFQGSQSPDFSDATDLYTIKTTPLYMNEVKLYNPTSFRYYRYISPLSGHADIAEFTLIDEKGQEIEGVGFGSVGQKGRRFDKAFDNNMNTYFRPEENTPGMIGIDLGQENKKTVSKIRFCPRNDTNCILPGNLYELFYWDNGWKSLGRKKSLGYKLTYEHVPKNALYWLRSHSGGIEERPFIYSNGKQVFW